MIAALIAAAVTIAIALIGLAFGCGKIWQTVKNNGTKLDALTAEQSATDEDVDAIDKRVIVLETRNGLRHATQPSSR